MASVNAAPPRKGSCCVHTCIRTKVTQPLLRALQSGLSPAALAKAFAIAVVFGIFPLPGTTTLLNTAAIVVFSLNPVVVQVVNLCMTPVNLATILPFVRFGMLVAGAGGGTTFSLTAFQTALSSEGIVATSRLFIAPILYGILGWTILAPLIGCLIFAIALPLARKATRRRSSPAASAAQSTPSPPPPSTSGVRSRSASGAASSSASYGSGQQQYPG